MASVATRTPKRELAPDWRDVLRETARRFFGSQVEDPVEERIEQPCKRVCDRQRDRVCVRFVVVQRHQDCGAGQILKAGSPVDGLLAIPIQTIPGRRVDECMFMRAMQKTLRLPCCGQWPF